MAGAGGMKRKSVQKRLREIRAAAADPRLNWVETPGWLWSGGPSILLPYDDVKGHLDEAAMAAVSRKDYLELVVAAVEAGDFPAYVDPVESWARLERYRAGEHHGHCGCPPCTAKKPAPPPPPVEPAGERYVQESGTQRRSDPATWREPDNETEQQRLTRIANNAPIRYFT